MTRRDGLDGPYRALAAAILRRALRDLERGGNEAAEVRGFFESEGAWALVVGLELDVERLRSWLVARGVANDAIRR